jgi:hypothetical protein
MCALYFILEVEVIHSLSLIQIQFGLEIYKGFWKIEKLFSHPPKLFWAKTLPPAQPADPFCFSPHGPASPFP